MELGGQILNRCMRTKLLPAYLIKRWYVQGESKCNYEIYLLELLNCSRWFDQHFPGGFTAPISEARGEDDANNYAYHLDFKLFGAQTAIKARNLLSPSITKLQNGITIYGESKSNETITATRIHVAFRRRSFSDLIELLDKQDYADLTIEESDVYAALKVLETQKNILLFYPVSFEFDKEAGAINDKEAVELISTAMNMDFKSAFEFRKNKAKELDTFLTCIYNDEFLMYKITDNQMKLIDTIKATNLPTFVELSNYKEW